MVKHTEPDHTLMKMPSLRAVKAFVAAARSIFFDAVQLSFTNIAQTAQRIRNTGKPKQRVTLCCSPAFANFWLSTRLPAFFDTYPEIDLNHRVRVVILPRPGWITSAHQMTRVNVAVFHFPATLTFTLMLCSASR